MLKGNKTILFALATALVPVLSMAGIVELIPEAYTDQYLVVVAVITAVLRVFTTTPVGKKG